MEVIDTICKCIRGKRNGVIHENANHIHKGVRVMNIFDAETFGAELIHSMKERRFKKRNLTWYRKEEDITIVLYIQKSQWGKDVWYYDYGVGINCLHESEIKTREKCEIGERFDQVLKLNNVSPCLKEIITNRFGDESDNMLLKPEDIIVILDIWIKMFGSLESIKEVYTKEQLPYWSKKASLSKLFN